MTEAPKRIVVLWTPADEDTMPATVAAHTEKSRDFVSGAPRWMDGERVEYIRADEVQRMIAKMSDEIERLRIMAPRSWPPMVTTLGRKS